MRHWLVNGIYTFDELCEDEAMKNDVPKLITAESKIDVKKLTALEQKVYDLDDKLWCDIEEKVMHSLPYKAWNHVNWRFCWKCKAIRPPRAHHCSKCECCHLRMDHHCYWVGNCVGVKNHKLFLIFASHSAIAAIL